jgi:signal transduction histidine kinase
VPFEPSTLRKLRWQAFLGLGVLVGLLEAIDYGFSAYLQTVTARLALHSLVVGGALVFFAVVFQLIETLQAQLDRQNRELLALHGAVLDVQGELALDIVLQKVVEQARQLVDAKYGALSVIGPDQRIQSFLTSGINPEERQRIGPPPTGHGLLGVSLKEGKRLRLADIASDPRRVGFPADHPPMRSLLAVPIPATGGFRGNLYVTNREHGREFTRDDEETLARFAAAAAIAIDNAANHQRLRSLAVAEERVRIAHELHDGTAQVLAYVNTKAQAVAEFLRAGRVADADLQLGQLAKAARDVYADVREQILGLRSIQDSDQSLADTLAAYLEVWRQQSDLEPTATLDQDAWLPPPEALQALRIAQEALANVRKHSGASTVAVRLRRTAEGLEIAIHDNGQGFDPEHTRRRDFPRFGLATMRERAESVGGTLRIESSPGAGTHVTLSIPVSVAATARGGAL